MSVTILNGDCREVLRTLPDQSAQCCVTSPPYYGLRDYGVDGQIGLEQTPEEYVAQMVAVFREVRRVLRDDGVLWLNVGDSYNAYNGNCGASRSISANINDAVPSLERGHGLTVKDSKPKDLLGIPWRLAFALQADGWFLRSEVIWHKPNPMPESVTDRPTKAHEQVFLLTKRARYFYDAGAVAEAAEYADCGQKSVPQGGFNGTRAHKVGKTQASFRAVTQTRNARTVWTIATQPFSGSHFATMPPALAERCIKAGSRPGDTVIDPFGGAGTTGLVADRLNRSAILVELNSDYAAMARERIHGDAPLFADVSA